MAFDKPQSRNEAILQNMLGANNELEPPKSRVEALLQELSGKMPEANPSEGTTTETLERLKIGDEIYTVEGGGSGTSDYDALNNKPQIAGVTLSGDKSLADLGIASASAVSDILDGTDIDSFGDVETALGDKVDKVNGKGLSTNDYDDTEKAAVAAATTAIAGIKDGTDIDSFADVETALAGKQGTLTAGDYISLNNGNIAVNRNIVRDNYAYNIKFSGDNDLTVTKSQGGTVISTTQYTYEYGSGGGVTYTIDDAFTLETLYHGGQYFKYTALRDSTTHSAGYTWEVDARDTSTDVTEYFSSEDLSGYKLVIKSELDTALSGKQDTLTFDDVPTDNSNNPVKSNGIYDALELKQDATDNSLETTDKTIVGAINEHEGDISTLKSGFTTLDNEVNGDATTYPYADVITIEDAVPANVADCSVKIEPVQDLHGYDHPWVGGAGKNQAYDVEYSDVTAQYGLVMMASYKLKQGKRYVISFDTPNSGVTVYRAEPSQLGFNSLSLYSFNCNGTRKSMYGVATADADFTGKNILYRYDETSATGTGELSNLQIEEVADDVTTPTDYAPYENICPITGHTEAVVARNAVNQWDEQWESGVYDAEGNPKSDSLYIRSKNYINVAPDTDYYWKCDCNSSYFSICYYDANKVFIKRDYGYNRNRVYRTPVNARYVRFNMTGQYGTSYRNDISINYPSTNTDYVPYAGKTYTIALGDTIYGGTVGVTNGDAVKDFDDVDFGDLTWQYDPLGFMYTKSLASIIKPPIAYTEMANAITDHLEQKNSGDIYDGQYGFGVRTNGEIRVRYPDMSTDPVTFTSDVTGWKICYELATPTTIQLTPIQIQLLKGQNTLTASTGQISVIVNGVSGAIGSVQEQANDTDEALAELVADIAEQLPTAPTTDGTYVLTVTVADGTPTYSWESAE